ncbi:Hsp20/alpha crystallin family protein [Pedobacter sp.]|uniref:Hsp20/alpha crystallin family protein n=1 Tax=Pedobacter sp. TaxID=1411316 RepID=UPI00396C9528
MNLVKFNPNQNKLSSMPGVDDVFKSIFDDTFFSDRMVTRVPAVNISETEDHYHIELAAPGLQKGDFNLRIDRNVLSISVEQSSQDNTSERNFSKREFSYNSFVRSFTLPEGADENNIEARYVDGLLKVDIAKKEEAKSVTRRIDIK